MLPIKLSFPKIIVSLTAVILTAVAFFRVHAFQDPSGGDGYFYLKQLEWLATHFRFYHADYSLVFLPLALLFKVTGSALFSYQILSCLNYGIILGCCGYFANQGLASLNPRLKGILIVLFVLGLSFQTPLQRISFEFVKNGFGLALFLLAGASAYKGKLRTTLLLAILAALTHKTIALMVVLWFGFYILKQVKYRKIYWLIPLVLLGIVISAVPRLSHHFSNFLTGLTLESYRSLFAFNFHLVWSHLVLIFFWLLMLALSFRKVRKFESLTHALKAFIYTLVVFSIVPILPAFGGENFEIKWRLMIFTFCFAFILYTFALSVTRSQKILWLSAVVSLALMTHEFWNETGFPWVAGWSHHAPNVSELTQFVQPGDELITHHGMQFYVDYKTPIRAKSLLSPNTPPKFQLAYIPEFYLLNPQTADTVNQVKLMSIGSSYGLFYYEDFQDLLKAFPILRDQKNTFKVRPDFVESYPAN